MRGAEKKEASRMSRPASRILAYESQDDRWLDALADGHAAKVNAPDIANGTRGVGTADRLTAIDVATVANNDLTICQRLDKLALNRNATGDTDSLKHGIHPFCFIFLFRGH